MRCARALSPLEIDFHDTAATCLAQTGQMASSREAIERIRESFPAEPLTWAVLAELETWHGNYADALALSLKAAAQYHGDAYAAAAKYARSIREDTLVEHFAAKAVALGSMPAELYLAQPREQARMIELDRRLLEHDRRAQHGDFSVPAELNAAGAYALALERLRARGFPDVALDERRRVTGGLDLYGVALMIVALRGVGEGAEADRLAVWLTSKWTSQVDEGSVHPVHLWQQARAFALNDKPQAALGAIEAALHPGILFDPGLTGDPTFPDRDATLRTLRTDPRYQRAIEKIMALRAEQRRLLPEALKRHGAMLPP
jgi:tetratricopeptide (TPR) repeat protein